MALDFSPVRVRLVLLAILLVALGLRLWGAFFDLPYIYHPDEPVNIKVVRAMVVNADPNPHYFHYPSLLYDVDALASWVYFGVPALVVGKPWSISDPLTLAMGTTYTASADAVMLYRLLTIFAAILSVLLVYLVGKQGWGERAGLLAAALLAISPPAIEEARHVTADSYVVLFELLVVLASLAVARVGRVRHYLVAGMAVGATAASKYNGTLVCLCVVAAHLFRYGAEPKHWGKPILAGAASILVFLVLTPYALFDTQTFLADATYEFGHYASGHQGMEGGSIGWYTREVFSTTGAAVLLAAYSAIVGWKRRNALCVVLVSFVVPYFIFISMFHVRNDRTLLPLVPCVLLLAASGFFALMDTRSPLRAVAPGLRRAVLVVLAAALLIGPLRHTIDQALAATTIDSRTTARQWIDSTLPSGSVIAIESYSPFVDPNRFRVIESERAIDHAPAWYASNGIDYLVLSQGMFGRYFADLSVYAPEAERYLKLLDSMTLVKKFDDGGYEVVVLRTRPDAERPQQ